MKKHNWKPTNAKGIEKASQLSKQTAVYVGFTGFSSAAFTANLKGTEFVFDSADWTMAAMKARVEKTPMRDLGIPKFAKAWQKEKIKLRGQTMVQVVDTILNSHCGCEVANQNVALTIAGYPTNNQKKLSPSKFAIGLNSITKPPVNMETLFARSLLAADSCYKKTRNIKLYASNGYAQVQLSEAQKWRNDDHLGQFTVECIFRSNKLLA